MTREEYFRMKAELMAIEEALDDGHLSPEERAAFKARSTALSRALLAPWIPVDWARRSIAVALFGGGLVGVVVGIDLLVWGWPLMLVLSPRVMGDNFHTATRRHGRQLI